MTEGDSCSTRRCRRPAAGCRPLCSSGSPSEGLSTAPPVTQLPGRRCREGLWRLLDQPGTRRKPRPSHVWPSPLQQTSRAHRSGAAARAFGCGAAGAGGPVQQPAVDRPGGHSRPGPAALHPAQTAVAIRCGPQRTAQPSGPVSKVAMMAQLGCAGPCRICGRKVGCRCSTSMRLAGQTAPRARRRITDYSAIVRLVANPIIGRRLQHSGLFGRGRAGRLRLAFRINNDCNDAGRAAVVLRGYVQPCLAPPRPQPPAPTEPAACTCSSP